VNENAPGLHSRTSLRHELTEFNGSAKLFQQVVDCIVGSTRRICGNNSREFMLKSLIERFTVKHGYSNWQNLMVIRNHLFRNYLPKIGKNQWFFGVILE